MAKSDLQPDADRLWADIMALAAITDPARPYTRRSFTPLFLEGRAWLAQRFAEAGLDHAHRRRRQSDRPASRAAIQRSASSRSARTATPCRPAAASTASPASRPGSRSRARCAMPARASTTRSRSSISWPRSRASTALSCVGSRGMSGALDGKHARSCRAGRRERCATRCAGSAAIRTGLARRSATMSAPILELHIEQGVGPGIAIARHRRRDVDRRHPPHRDRVRGRGRPRRHHADGTCGDDALVAAANTVAAVARIAEQLDREGSGYFVATVGILTVEPSASNIVPGRCRLVVDARATDPALTKRFVALLDRESEATAEAARVRRIAFSTLSDGAPVACDPDLQAALRKAADDLGLRQTDLPSGAGHDAAFMSRICRSAMVFVPCRAGKSHTPEEWADRDAVAAGAAVILRTVEVLDRSLQKSKSGAA